MARVNNIKKTGSTADGVYASVESMLQLRHVSKDLILETKKRSVAIMDGDAKTHFRGRGMDFAEVRPYQAGDDIRNIDWRITARTQKPYTKLYQEERERPVFILVDQRSSMFFGSQNQFKSVLAAKLAAIIGWAALNNNDRIGALIFSDTEQTDSRARRGKHAQLSLLHLLHQYNTQLNNPASHSSYELYEMLTDLHRVAKPGSSIFVLSDFHDYSENCKEPLALLSRHTDVTLLQIYDELERQLPFGKNLVVSNGETKTNLSNASQRFANEFHASFDELSQHIHQDTQKLGMRFGTVSTRTAAEDAAIDIFSSKYRKNKRRANGGEA